MTNLGRRNILKAISAGGAAAALPFSLQAKSLSNHSKQKHYSVYIDASNGHSHTGASSEIINQSDKPLTLNGYQPVTIKNTDGMYTTLHLNTPNEVYHLQPGERLPIYARAVMTNAPNKLSIANSFSQHPVAIV